MKDSPKLSTAIYLTLSMGVLFLLISWRKSQVLGEDIGIWYGLGGVLALAGVVIVTIIRKSIIPYYVLNAAGKMLHQTERLNELDDSLVMYRGTLSQCCSFLNAQPNQFIGKIVDGDLKKAGKLVDGKWRPI